MAGRKSDHQTAGEAIGALQDELRGIAPDLFHPQDDEEFWAKKDAEVAAQRAAEEAAELEKWRAARAVDLVAGGAPKRFVDLVLSDRYLSGLPATSWLRSWRGGGVRALSGGVGFGKTVTAVWWLAHHGGSKPAYLRAAALEAAGRYDKKTRSLWSEASSMVLDDLGAEYADSKANFLAALDEIVDVYNSDGRALIITTNLLSDAFLERYGERIASRIREGQGWCKVVGRDLRAPSQSGDR